MNYDLTNTDAMTCFEAAVNHWTTDTVHICL